MNLTETIIQLTSGAKLIAASSAERYVPRRPGLYAISVDDPSSLPAPFGGYLATKKTLLIYVGKASVSLQKRLVAQDLRGKGHSTFFRSIGAILGYLPPAGSLRDKINQNNYVFADSDAVSIVDWINRRLSIRWVVLPFEELENIEPYAITALRPLLNSVNNPDAHAELAELRDRCRSVARG